MSQESRFVPAQYQKPLAWDQLILNDVPENPDAVPMDVVFVGGGPAGLCGAIELARLVKDDNEKGGSLGSVEIGVLEKASSLGGHSLSGAVVNPMALQMLFPDLKTADFPFRQPVPGDAVYMLNGTGAFRLPTPPTMHNTGNYVASICEIVRWLGGKAEELGVNLLTSFPADSLLVRNNKVEGVRTTAAGLDRNSQPGGQYMPPTDIMAQITVLTEGTRGPLTQAYLNWQKVSAPAPQIYALGVKEVWRLKKTPESVIHTMGWPLPTDAFGGSFFYPMGDDMAALGLVVGLDYRQSALDVHKMLQQLKEHTLFKPYFAGGSIVEWGAKTIPEGGFHSLPSRLHGDGILLAGDCVGMVNVPALKGIHYAMLAGIFAARSAFQALKAKNTSAAQLSSYDQMVKNSVIHQDLYKVRNMRQAFKSGFYVGGAKAAMMTLTAGHFPGGAPHHEEDAQEWKQTTKGEKGVGLSKVDAVYLSANKTRDDIPSHLSVADAVPPHVADFYTHMCPAGVYEMQGDRLVVNAPNCVDCKATDVLGPRWRPREGGSGPNYTVM
ncbi:MAG: 4Fe-4S dicluster domain-containing protein [Bdellovibrionales bacterium]|nr:4Fe-4S dicluster domain-containing protein [Bdellovibrionales bacterium]